MEIQIGSLRLANGGRRPMAEKPEAKLDEKAKVRSKADLFSAFGVEITEEGALSYADYREMMRDAQVKAAVMFKILARLSSGWDISPASKDPADLEVARFVEDNLARMKGTATGFLRRTMLAMAYGQTIHEMVLHVPEEGEWKDKVCIKEFKWKRPENYRCMTDDFGNLTKLQQKAGNDWTDLDPLYFIIWCWDHEGDFKGKSDLRPAYRWFKGKELLDLVWNVYLEKYATPTPVGKFPPGAKDPEKDEVLGFLMHLHHKKAAVVPKNWEVDLLESKRTGGDYHQKMQYCDRMIARTMLLPTLVVDEGDKGAYALGQQHADNFTWVLEALGDEVAEEIMLEQVIRPLVDWNFTVEDYPTFKWRGFNTVDLEKMAIALEKLVGTGVIGPQEEWIREKLEVPAADPNADQGAGPTKGAGSGDDDGQGGRQQKRAGSGEGEDGGKAEFRSGAARKHDWRAIKARTIAIEDRAVGEIATATESMFAKLKLTIKRKQLVENRDLAGVRALKMPGIGLVRNSLETAFGHQIHWGAKDALDEVKAGLAVTGKKLPPLPDTMAINLAAWHPEEWEPTPESLLSSAEIIAHWEGKVPIQKALMTEYSREAFTMAGAYQDNLLSGSQQILGKGIRRGASYQQMEAELAAFFRPYMEIEGAIDPALASPYRIETIVRTTMSEAYNTGRMNLYKHPDVGNMIVAYEYSAVMDDRTTPFCTDWDGEVLLANDPRIDQNNPPNHFRCRSVWIPITKGEKFSVTDQPPAATPAQGFSY